MLYFVATPIGNLAEITYRAVEVLNAVDVIYAEDTRHTLILLNKYEISKPLISYQKFNEKARADEIVSALKNGQNIAVVSDAGMPLISDPGNILSKRLVENNLDYTVVSGACAAVNALVLSGLDTSSFCMIGFLPSKKSERERYIAKFKNLECTLIFYTPPHDVEKDLEFLHLHLGERKAAVVREISKKFETVHRGILGQSFDITLKGEMVIVVEGGQKSVSFDGSLSPQEHIKSLINEGMDKKEAIKIVAKIRGIPKSEVYKLSLDI